ncbi:MAG TPA: glycosyltransferase [Methylomirabilota bacterium]|jgi:glycosyltransferase involved in cell wall biosynthesis|nr:glycosyltransferase [Methylomirabilota bacterium]
MRITFVHEFLNQLGGAERVLQNFHEIWPDAPVDVILFDNKKTRGEFENYLINKSFLNNWPGTKSHPKLFLGLMPKAIESFRFPNTDVVLSDSSSFAKGAKTDRLHICYCHTPTRFLWTDDDYLSYQKYPLVLKWLGGIILPWLRTWDFQAAQRPDFLIANSVNVQQRIKKYYKRDSIIIPPPVDTEFFHPVGNKENYFLVASRLEPYKKTDIVIKAFNQLGLKLKIVGTGSELERLKKISKPNIEFLGRVSDEDLRKLYSEAQAYIFPAEEDAGITLIEAQACSTPVLAYGAGGALETVISGKTGEFFKEQTAESVKQAVENFDLKKYNLTFIRKHAEQYDKQIFQKKIKDFVEEKYADWN